ncbi:MAG: cytochrome c [Thermosynechococcaceae cyanobacterium]
MEEPQTLSAAVNLQRVVLIVLALSAIAILIAIGSYYWQRMDPYIQQVFVLQGDANRGHSIFQLNCAGCHGTLAEGKVGPSLRGVAHRRSQLSLVQQVISGKTPPMPKFQASPSEMADLLSYLKSL